MSKSRTPVDPDLIPPTDESPAFVRQELAPSGTDEDSLFDDPPAPAAEEDPPAEEPSAEEHEDEVEPEQAYDENGQPYPQQDEQGYDEHGQPYPQQDEQGYDEHGQPYGQQPAYEEHETAPYDAQAYETSPMTGPPHLLQHMQQMQHVQPMQHMQVPMQHMQVPMQQMQAPMLGMPPQGPPSAGGPYRVPPYDPFLPARGVPIPRPLLGSAMAVYGVLLWSFVVAGQFTTSWISGAPMDQGLAVLIIFACTLTAWIVAARRSRAALPTTTPGKFAGRFVGIGALAFGAFFLTMMIAALCGEASSGSGHDFLIAFTLIGISIAASAFGPRLTHPLRPAPTHGMRFAVVLVWIAGAIATFVAGAELATSG